MNLDLRLAYRESMRLASSHEDVTIDMLKHLSSLVMKNTGSEYSTVLGSFSAANGDLRLLNVSAGFEYRSYLCYQKVPTYLELFCEELNEKRKDIDSNDLDAIYRLSFEAH